MISFRKVKINSLQGKTLVHETSFEVVSAKIVGFYGPNGSGKSSLLKVLSGQVRDREVSGENWNDEMPIFDKNLSAKVRSQKILYIGSDFQTPFQISVRELLEMAKEANPSSQENISEVAESFGITSLLFRSFDEMSDGEKQRVMLARGIVQSPKWLVLDETFSKIDLDHSFHLIGELKKRAKNGLGIFIASHDLNLISEMVDDLWFIKNGRIVVSGSIEDVLTTENLKQLYPDRVVHVVRSPDNGKKKVIY